MIHIITVEHQPDNSVQIIERTESGTVKVCETILGAFALDDVSAKAHGWAELYGAEVCMFQGQLAIDCAKQNHKPCRG